MDLGNGNMTHVMIDVETLGTRPGSVVTQIGVCAFDIRDIGARDLGLGFNLDPQDCLDYGMKADWSTIRWWMEQSKDAQATLPRSGEGLSIHVAMRLVQDYINRVNQHGRLEGVWANGQDFDLPLMANLFELAGCKVPWRYNLGRDIRTLRAAVDFVHDARGEGAPPDRPQPTIAHNALSDCHAQIVWVQRLWGSLPGRSANGSPTAAAEKE